MKMYITSGRDTITINHLSLPATKDRGEAHSIAPFLVRAKWTLEPEIRANSWDEPDSPEYFAFDGLYVYGSDAHFVTDEGELVTVKPHDDLLRILGEPQLQIIEDILRESWERDAEDSYEPMLDYEYGI